MFALAWITVFENSRGSTTVGAEWLSWPDNSLAEEGAVAAAVPVFCLQGDNTNHRASGDFRNAKWRSDVLRDARRDEFLCQPFTLHTTNAETSDVCRGSSTTGALSIQT